MSQPFHHRAFQAQIAATYETPEYEATFTLERQVAEARALMGEQKWQRLMAEWNTPVLADLQGRAG